MLKLLRLGLSALSIFFTTSHAIAQTTESGSLAGGLVTWLQLDETSGAKALDASGSGRSAVLANGGSWQTAGRVRGALRLTPGTSLQIPLRWQPTAFTISWWVKAPAASIQNWTQAVGASLEEGNAWSGFLFHTSASGIIYAGTDASTRLVSNPGAFSTGWQHFTFTFNRGEASLYRNGIMLATRTGMTMPAPWKTLAFGAITNGSLRAEGDYDDIRVYDRALTSEEVSRLATSSSFVHTPPTNPTEDLDRNWSFSRSYDGNGNVLGESKRFSDAMGRPTQAQVKSQTSGHVLATQTVYSSGGKPVLSTLAAPVNNADFSYKSNFMTSGGTEYQASHFEGVNANNPAAVDQPATPGSVGYYYSTQNTLEPLTATTTNPFSLTEEYEGPLGGVKRAAGPGEAFRMGGGHEAKGREFLLLNELDHYLSLRPQFVPGATLATTLRLKGEKAVSVNANGVESIAFTDADNKTLATCLSGPQYPGVELTAAIHSDPANTDGLPPYLDVHIPAAGTTALAVTGTGEITLVNLLTDAVQAYTCPTTIPLQPGFYRVVSKRDNQALSYLARYGDFSYSYYDDAGRVVASIAPKGIAAGNTVKNGSFDQEQAFTYSPSSWQSEGDIGYCYTETYGGAHTGAYHGTHYSGSAYSVLIHQLVPNLPAGLYTLRAWVKGSGGQTRATMFARNFGGVQQSVTIPATPNGPTGEWRMVEIRNLSVTNGQCDVGFDSQAGPNQFIYYDDVELFRQSDTAAPQFVTRNTFSGAGTLMATESPDEGRTEYIYARDGRIRFSQSALQRQTNKFSYTNYDEVGRVVESGEYQSPTSTPQNLVLAQLEAEAAQTNAYVAPSAANASGGAVGYLTELGRYVSFTVNAPRAGAYALDLRYAAGVANSERTITLHVNGNPLRQLTFAPTGSWTTWATQPLLVQLQAGANTVKVQYDASDNGYIDLDYLKVTDLTQGMVFQNQLPKIVAYEAENANAGSNPPATNHPGYRGAGFIGNLTSTGSFIEFNVTVPTAGRYPVHIRYAAALANSERAMPVYVNWEYVFHATFPATNAWGAWKTQTVDMELRAGSNLIRLQHDGRANEGWINVDYLEVAEEVSPVGSSVLHLLEDRTRTGGLDVARCSQRNQVWYDLPQDTQPNGRIQDFVLGGVAKTTNGTNTTWYSYDELGRVTWLVQQVPGVGQKTVDYTYDFSGNVLEVAYQKGQPDAFFHHYEYDADKRLRTVHTSPDGLAQNRTLHARYFYYLHGPLKRVEVADRLQGIDYAYTVQGWLKSINNSQKELDPGRDSPNANGVLKDLFGMRLDYFNGDYASRQLTAPNLNSPANQNETRYDGSVRASTWQTAAAPTVHGYAYRYDAKGQLLQSDYGQLTGGTLLSQDATKKFEEGNLDYDAHGNILSLRRRNDLGDAIDDFSYLYTAATNKLQAVRNPAGANVLSYDYDVIGQMTRESEAGKGDKYLRYDVTGKVTGVYRNADFTGPVATYAYDDRGFRSTKVVYAPTGAALNTTYYVTDAQGNVLSTYEQPVGQALQRTEISLYGSGRVGTLTRLDDGTLDARYELNDQLGNARVIFHKPTTTKYLATMEPSQASREEAEFQNIAATRAGGPMWDGYFSARLRAATGLVEGPKKTLNVEKGDTITFTAMALYIGNSQARSTASSLAPYVAIGGVVAGSTLAPRNEVENATSRSKKWLNPLGRLSVGVAIPLIGHAFSSRITPTTAPAVYLRYRLYDPNNNSLLQEEVVNMSVPANTWEELKLRLRLSKAGRLELSTISNAMGTDAHFDFINIEHTTSTIVQEQHTYAFGSPLVGLNYIVGDKRYRHGYQGQYAEKDEETGYDSFELRLYNSRIGRWTTFDPKGQFDSPYVGMSNNPIINIDKDGGFSGPGAGLLSKIKSVFTKAPAVLNGGTLGDVIVTGTKIPYAGKGVSFINNIIHGTAKSFVLVGSAIAAPLINQGNIIRKEGLHSGGAYNSDNNVSWATPYTLDNWQIKPKTGMMGSSGYDIPVEDGMELLGATADVVMNRFVTVTLELKTSSKILNAVGNHKIPIIANNGIGSLALKSTIKDMYKKSLEILQKVSE